MAASFVRSLASVAALSLLASPVVAAKTSVRLGRKAHRFDSGPRKEGPLSWRQAGNSIPMNGGVLTLGAYFLELTVGTGAGQQTFDVLVDTGSSNTAVPSVGCTSCQTSALYNASASPTSSLLECSAAMCQNCAPVAVGTDVVPPDANLSTCLYNGGGPMCSGEQCGFGISYGGSGTAIAGTIVQDVACLPGGLCSSIYIDQITTEYPNGTLNTGILGLAFPANSCSPTCQPTILDSFVASGALPADADLFGMCLTPSDGGILDLGHLNASRFSGDMLYTDIVREGWYNIAVRDILVGGQSLGVPEFLYLSTVDSLGAFVDSGTSVILVAPYAFGVFQDLMVGLALPKVNELFSGSSCANLTTSEIAAYPDISFTIKGAQGQPDFSVSLPGANYLMPVNGLVCMGVAGVPSIGVILGDIIMTNYYIAFDRVNSRLGFAPITACA